MVPARASMQAASIAERTNALAPAQCRHMPVASAVTARADMHARASHVHTGAAQPCIPCSHAYSNARVLLCKRMVDSPYASLCSTHTHTRVHAAAWRAHSRGEH